MVNGGGNFNNGANGGPFYSNGNNNSRSNTNANIGFRVALPQQKRALSLAFTDARTDDQPQGKIVLP